ncbi:MAG: hypothetical protein RL172_1595, partial [Bacteroidota bacterium]
MKKDIEIRVAQLERSVKMYQLLFTGCLLLATVVLVSSFKEDNNSQVPEKITAKAFEVVDANGKPLVKLSAYNGSGAISTLNAQGQYLVDVIANNTGFGNINVYDGKGKATVQLYNTKGGGGAVSIKNVFGQDAVKLGLMTSGSGHIGVNNSSGNALLWLGETTERNADLKLY